MKSRLGIWIAAGVAAMVVLLIAPIALIAFVLGGAAGGGGADAVCEGAGGTPEQGGQPGGGGPGLTGGNQLAYAQLITSVVAGRGLPQQAAVVAIATAAQESGLGQAGMNAAVDHDSLGLFQQRPSAGWGSPAQVKDPTYATNTFLDHLVKLGGWATMPVTVAAQRVQSSATPTAYAQWEDQAKQLAAKFWPAGTPPGGNPAAAAATPAADPSAAGAQDCPGEGGDGMAPDAGGTTPPPGYVAPDSPQLKAVLNYAMAQLGKPYQWGASGPGAFDCSGLMFKAWAAAGVILPRTAAAQSQFGAPVADVAQLQPGDLIFIPGSGGSVAAPGHVGMYIGGGNLIHAPQTGSPVQIAPVAKWQGKISGMRRPGGADPDAPSVAAAA